MNARTSKTVDSSREDREMETIHQMADKSLDNGDYELTFEMLANMDNNILPDPLHKHPDYHYCWFAHNSNNQMNYARATAKLGYRACKLSEYPEFADRVSGDTMDNSMNDGIIQIREMVLCKTTKRNYNTWMNYYHHKLPNQMSEDSYKNMANDRNRVVMSKRGGGYGSMQYDVEWEKTNGVSEEGNVGFDIAQNNQLIKTREPIFE